MDEKTRYKVCVRCATFNHKPYITATLDGFCRQQTDFPFVCVIIDDASKDGEQEVISQYLHERFNTKDSEETADYSLTFAQHKEKPNCHFAVLLLKYNHYGIGKSPLTYAYRWMDESQYVALCEGDDYWTDSGKLQRQVDELDANPKAVMVYTGFRIVDGEDKPMSKPLMEPFPKYSHSGDNLPTLLEYENYVMTLTTMYRREVWQTESYRHCPHGLDFGLTMAAALMGDFVYLPEQTANYRSLAQSMVRSGIKQGMEKIQDIYRYYALLVMSGQCKPLSLRERINITTLILMRALKKKDQQLKKDALSTSRLAWVMLPVAYIKMKMKRLYIND